MSSTKEKVSRARIDEEKFIKVWAKVYNRGGSLQNVVDEMGCTLGGAYGKAKSLVESGVKLPKLARASNKKERDVKSLNDVLRNELSKK